MPRLHRIIRLVQNRRLDLQVRMSRMDSILPLLHGLRLVPLHLVEVNGHLKILIRYLNLEIEVTVPQTLNPNLSCQPPAQPQPQVLLVPTERAEREIKTFQTP